MEGMARRIDEEKEAYLGCSGCSGFQWFVCGPGWNEG